MSPYSQLVLYKQWVGRGLHEVVAGNIGRLDAEDASILMRILDHIHIVDRIFQHHLQGVPHGFHAPRSDEMPDLPTLARQAAEVDDWYVSHVGGLPDPSFDEPLDFVFTSGKPARMTRGEIILHVCSHGTYHRGNAGLVLQKNGIMPNRDAITDFLQEAA